MRKLENGAPLPGFAELGPLHEDYDVVFGLAPDTFDDSWWRPLVETGYRVESDFEPYASMFLKEAGDGARNDALSVCGSVFEPNGNKPVTSVEIHTWRKVPRQKVVQLYKYDFSVLRTLLASGLRVIGRPSIYASSLFANSFQLAGMSTEILTEWFVSHGFLCRAGKRFNEWQLALQSTGTECSIAIGNYLDATNGEMGIWIGPVDIRVKSPGLWRPNGRAIIWPKEFSEIFEVYGSRICATIS